MSILSPPIMKDTQTKHTDAFYTYLEVTLCVGFVGDELFEVVNGCEVVFKLQLSTFSLCGGYISNSILGEPSHNL
jgi:hypothetical protein